MTILIAHSTTPTGFGIRQRRNGSLRPTSKCCGRSMVHTNKKVLCKGCEKDYSSDAVRLKASLGNDVDLDKLSLLIVECWVERVTGFENINLDVVW